MKNELKIVTHSAEESKGLACESSQEAFWNGESLGLSDSSDKWSAIDRLREKANQLGFNNDEFDRAWDLSIDQGMEEVWIL